MGTVYRAFDHKTRSQVAVKIVPKRNLHNNAEKTALSREVSLLEKLDHANILSFRDAFEDSHAVYVVTEFCESGDLFTYLNRSRSPIPEREALMFLRQMLHAIAYLNKNGISHRDIKPENILMADRRHVKLADLGLCHWRSPTGSRQSVRHCGTLQYCAPEIAYCKPYVPERSDMWSCGIVLYAMLTQSLPFKSQDSRALRKEILTADLAAILRTKKLAHVSKGCIVLLTSLLSRSPSQRPTPMEAIDLVDDALLGRPKRPASRLDDLEWHTKQMPW